MKQKNLFTTFIFIFIVQILFAQPITTIVGTGVLASNAIANIAGDPNGDGNGTGINLNYAGEAMCHDAIGNIYFTDRNAGSIRKWNATTHLVTTIVGNGVAVNQNLNSYINTGTLPHDGMQATSVPSIASWGAICVTPNGRYLYFANSAYQIIRMVDLNTGILSTLVGYNSGNGALCTSQNVNDNGAAVYGVVQAAGNSCLALDNNNNMYIAHAFSRVRKISVAAGQDHVTSSSIITTIAYGYPTNSINDGPSGVNVISVGSPGGCGAVAGYGYLDFDGGFGANSICVDGNFLYYKENHYFGSPGAGLSLRIRKINLTTFAISTPPQFANIVNNAMTVNITSFCKDVNNNFYLSDYGSGQVYKISSSGIFSIIAGNPTNFNTCSAPFNNAPISNTCLSYPSVIIDAQGNLILAEYSRHYIHKVTLCSSTPEHIVGASSLCIGATATYTCATAGGTWSVVGGRATINLGGTATGTNSGNTTIRYTLPIIPAAGCTNYTAFNLQVNPIQLVPSIGYAPGNLVNPTTPGVGLTFCSNRIFTLAGNPAGGTWSTTGVASITNAGVVSTGLVAGATTIRYTTAGACGNSRTIPATVVICVPRGIANNGKLKIDNLQFSIYPNPARSVVSLQVDKLIGAGNIVVTNLYGKQVKTQALSMGTNTIDVSSFAKGMYLVSIITSEGKKTEKLIVE